jgi:hypothetical protein
MEIVLCHGRGRTRTEPYSYLPHRYVLQIQMRDEGGGVAGTEAGGRGYLGTSPPRQAPSSKYGVGEEKYLSPTRARIPNFWPLAGSPFWLARDELHERKQKVSDPALQPWLLPLLARQQIDRLRWARVQRCWKLGDRYGSPSTHRIRLASE